MKILISNWLKCCYGQFYKAVILLIILFSTYQAQSQHSVARQWNEVMLHAIRNDFARPTVHARNLWHTSTVMYDAWAAYDSVSQTCFLGDTLGNFYCAFTGVPTPSNIDSARNKAISYAAFRLLKHRFQNSPGASESLPAMDSLMLVLGYDINYVDTNYTTGNSAALGNYIAQCMINFGLQDGSNEQNDYANIYYTPANPTIAPVVPGNPDINDPNRWQPITLQVFIDQSGNVIPINTPPFLSPEWGDVVPFAMDNSDRTLYNRNGDNYWVYKDPGAPPYIDTATAGGLTDEYKWGFSLVNEWASHLDTTDGVMWDISPASIGNVPAFPQDIPGLRNFYDFENGGDNSKGYSLNPKTGTPYPAQMVRRGDYARVLAEFWADGPDSETPPGHWYTILNYVNDHPQHVNKWRGQGAVLDDLEWDVKAYLCMGGAVHDAAVAAWSIKGWYDYLRPISAIRYMADNGQCTDTSLANYSPLGIPLIPGKVEVVEVGDPLAGAGNQHVGKIKMYTWKGPDYISNPVNDMAGVGWILAENWWPYQRPTFVTPPFAGYVSGHSTFSRAAAEVMTLMTGDAYFPGGVGEFIAPKNEFLVFEEGPSQDITLQWATYRDASDQCSLSRIWGGIHPPADDIPGRVIGEELGVDAFHFAEQYFNPECTIVITDSIINPSCIGASDGSIAIALSGSPSPLSVSWSTGDTTLNISNLSAGLYTITVTDNNACTTEQIILVENPEGFATISTGSATTFCAGVGAILNAPFDSTYSYQWYRFSNPLSGANASTLLAKQNGPYWCVINNNAGCIDTSNSIITTKLDRPLAIINEVSPIEMCGPGPAQITCVTASDYSYEWLRYGKAAPFVNTDSVYEASKGGNYKIKITDSNGCVSVSSKLIVIKNKLPKVEVDLLGPLFECVGDTVELNAIVTRGAPPFQTYQWYRYNNVLVNDTSASINVFSTGGYSVRVTDSKGCQDKSPRTVVNFSSCSKLESESAGLFNVEVYPNPFTNSIYIKLPDALNERINIKIMDALGRMVFSLNNARESEYELNTSDFNKGIYILEVTQGEKIRRIKLMNSQ